MLLHSYTCVPLYVQYVDVHRLTCGPVPYVLYVRILNVAIHGNTHPYHTTYILRPCPQVQVMNSLGLGTFSEPREIEVEGVPAWLIIAVIAAVVGAATLVAIFIVVVCVVRMCVRKR